MLHISKNNFTCYTLQRFYEVSNALNIRDPWTSDLILRDENNPAQTPLVACFFSETSMSSAQQLNDFVRWAVGP